MGLELPVSGADFQILAKARELLASPAAWNRHDDRACEDAVRQNSWSLFCALYQASVDVTGEFLASRPVLAEVRGAAGEARNGRTFQHLLMDYNNLESTTYADIAAVFERAETRLQARRTCSDHRSEWSVVERDSSAIIAHNQALAPAAMYWNEPISYTVHGTMYRLQAMVGPLNATGKAPDKLLAESKDITRRTWKSGAFEGLDLKGALSDGSRWRYFALCGDYLGYFDVAPEAAAYFDRIIDGAYLMGRKQ